MKLEIHIECSSLDDAVEQLNYAKRDDQFLEHIKNSKEGEMVLYNWGPNIKIEILDSSD